MFRFVHPHFLCVITPLLFGVALYRWLYYKATAYAYPLATAIKKLNVKKTISFKPFYFVIRFFSLLLLSLMIAQLQIVDTSSKVRVEGVDIMLVLDVSLSMMCCDDMNDRTSRIDIAKREAIRFIGKRDNDPIGLVIFGRQAVSRCPLTLDKNVLEEIITNTEIGIIEERGTVLAKSILTAANRLRSSTAKSKVMILLTDGEPTEDDSNPHQAIELAKKLGIKIYTIGIGSEQGGFMVHPQFGMVPAGTYLNKELLQKIAQETGGKFFEAGKPHELRSIYDQIDRLEKTEHEVSVFTHYHDLFIPLIWLIVCMMSFQLILSTFVRFIL